MKTLLMTLLLGGIAMLSSVTPAEAATYESYHCHCTAAKGETCSCSYDYTLGKSATKEFRGYCDYDTSGDSGSIDPPGGLTVSGRDKNTTCTFTAHTANLVGGYMSKSCTNWNPFSTDHISIKVSCENRD